MWVDMVGSWWVWINVDKYRSVDIWIWMHLGTRELMLVDVGRYGSAYVSMLVDMSGCRYVCIHIWVNARSRGLGRGVERSG